MFKKMLITAIIATAVFAAGSAVYAQSETEYTRNGRDVAPIFELLSDKEASKTFESEYVVSATSKEGTEVSMNLYWFGTEDEKSILAKKKAGEDTEKEGSWILQESRDLEVGSSGIFAESVSLNLGRNKIVLFIKDIKGSTAEKSFEIERFLKKEASEKVSGDSFNKLIKDIFNSTNKNQ